MNWEPTADGRVRCNRHPKVEPWEPGRHRCPECAADPGPVELDIDDLAAPTPAPEKCLSSSELEAQLVDTAKLINKTARSLIGKGKGRINYATAFQGFDIALKYWRATIDMCSTRERREYVARLERLQRARDRRRPHGGGN